MSAPETQAAQALDLRQPDIQKALASERPPRASGALRGAHIRLARNAEGEACARAAP